MCFYVCMCVCICISVVTCMKVYLKEFPSKYKYFLLKNVCQIIWLHPTQTVFSPIPQWYPWWVSSTLMNFVELIILKIHFEGVVQRWKLKIEQGRRRRRLLRVKELCWWNKWKFWGTYHIFRPPKYWGYHPVNVNWGDLHIWGDLKYLGGPPSQLQAMKFVLFLYFCTESMEEVL